MMDFNNKKTDEEFKQPNMLMVSDDEEVIMNSLKQTNVEHQRFYNKFDLQNDIKSDTEETTRSNKDLTTRDFQKQAQPSNSATIGGGGNVMQWLMKQCGLDDESLKKLQE